LVGIDVYDVERGMALIFSIIIPTFNRAKIICSAIDSVLDQNYNNCEIIVVDDSSVDNSVEYIRSKYKTKVKIVELAENKGQNFARNRGAELAIGEWLVFLDSDDSLTEGSLEILARKLDDNLVDILFAPCIDSNGLITTNRPNFEGTISYKDYLCGYIQGEHLPIHRKSAFLKCYFDESTRRAPNIGHLRVAKKSESIFITNFIARNYNTIIEDSLTSRLKNKDHKSMKIVQGIILKETWLDRLKYCPLGLIKNLAKYCYYFVHCVFVK
jgi:glycosyltransferase involved in cell wall biosynthesis